MSDLTERLRDEADECLFAAPVQSALVDEAADRIDELEATHAQWLAKWEAMECEWCGSNSWSVDPRIEELEAALREIVLRDDHAEPTQIAIEALGSDE